MFKLPRLLSFAVYVLLFAHVRSEESYAKKTLFSNRCVIRTCFCFSLILRDTFKCRLMSPLSCPTILKDRIARNPNTLALTQPCLAGFFRLSQSLHTNSFPALPSTFWQRWLMCSECRGETFQRPIFRHIGRNKLVLNMKEQYL